MPETLDITGVDQMVERHGRGPEAVIPILQAIQTEYRYLPDAALERVCEITEITPASIEGVATFYSQFRRDPVGNHVINLCDGTACHGIGELTAEELGALPFGDASQILTAWDTDSNGTVSEEEFNNRPAMGMGGMGMGG